VPHLRPETAQLAFLHGSAAFRATGIGSRLSEELELIARGAGDTEIVVSATPSKNTVRFYLSRGYQLMAQALPELHELEPEDVHMRKELSALDRKPQGKPCDCAVSGGSFLGEAYNCWGEVRCRQAR